MGCDGSNSLVREKIGITRSGTAFDQPMVLTVFRSRALNEALRLGAFSVMEKPVDVEQLLGVFRRLMDKRYRGNWPGCQ